MGLPIWRDPGEVAKSKTAVHVDPTAASRSTIRRTPTPSANYRRRSSAIRSRLARESTVHPNTSSAQQYRDTRRGTARGVPSISSLLEATHGRDVAHIHPSLPPPPAPPVPESRNYHADGPAVPNGGMGTNNELAHLEQRARQLRQETMRLRQLAAMARRRTPMQPSQSGDQVSTTIRASPEPIVRHDRPQSRDGASARRRALPTPPLDSSDPDVDSLFMPEVGLRTAREPHPLSNSWRPDSPVNGLGDRNRSPTPADNWEIMRSTITPDATLPSADSSFTSAAASHSFTTNNENATVESEGTSSLYDNSQRSSSDGNRRDSVSSVDPDDMICVEDDDGNIFGPEVYANAMYDFERRTEEGRERIRRHDEINAREGDRFALMHEGPRVDIGFRLIEEALRTDEGRERLLQISLWNSEEDIELFEEVVQNRRQDNVYWRDSDQSQGARIYDDEPQSPQPERWNLDERSRNTVRQLRQQTQDYFRRHPTQRRRSEIFRLNTIPPNPLGSHPDVDTFTSQEGPQPHPVSPPSQRSTREVSEAFLSGDEGDLSAMRRVVERLARRDDVPDEWWTSIGLNLSRTQPRALSPLPPIDPADEITDEQMQALRFARGGSRL